MVLDLVIIYFGLALVVAGWNIGARNSWPAPFAVCGAIALTQAFYMNFAAVLVQELSLPTKPAIFLGYAMLWTLFEFILEVTLIFFLPAFRRIAPRNKWNKSGGALIAFCKAMVLVVCASVAAFCSQGIAAPTKYPLVSQWITEDSHQSTFLKHGSKLAVAVPGAVAVVVSSKSATFRPSFERRPAVDYDPKKAENYAQLFQQMKSLEEQVNSL